MTFEVVGSPTDLIFKANDPELTENAPILRLLSEQDRFGFRNGSTGMAFDITDAKVIQYNMVQLSSDVDQPEVSYGDIFLGIIADKRGTLIYSPVSP